MPSLLVEMPSKGLDSLVPPSEMDMRGAAPGSQNLLYQYGIMRTPYGFAKLDLTTGLNSGDTILAAFLFTESDGTDHIIAKTTERIYEHDAVNSTWKNLTQSGLTMNSDLIHPVSWASYLHDDTDIYLDDNSGRAVAYHHLIVCDGGLTNIQRWAGRWEQDFADLTMTSGDYGTGQTTHRALQVGIYMNRLILISPLEYDSASRVWVENNQRVRWNYGTKLQNWVTDGSNNTGGFVNLVETNDENVWSGLLGNQYIIYQKKSIWGLNYVGSSTIFSPLPVIKDLGLLSHHLFVSHNNIHYFVGNDFNVYKYFGGSVKIPIGDPVHKNLREDLNPIYANRCWMVMGSKSDYLWIFIVPTGSEYVTMAYEMNMKTQAWNIRDFTHKWSTGGITAAGLGGGQTYIIGDTYATALNKLSAYDAADDTATTAGDVTEKYGDVLFDNTGQVLDWSVMSAVAEYDFSLKLGEVDFSAGGLFFCFSYANDPTKLVGDDTDYSNMIIRFDDGSLSTDIPNGSHYYTITDVSSTLDAGTDYTVTCHIQPSESAGTGIADTSSDTPALDGTSWMTLFDPSGETYRQKAEERRTDDAMMFGDDSGLIYQEDYDMSACDDGEDVLWRHRTPVIDWNAPDIWKRWAGIAVVAKGDSYSLRYRTSDFDTSETGWRNIS